MATRVSEELAERTQALTDDLSRALVSTARSMRVLTSEHTQAVVSADEGPVLIGRGESCRVRLADPRVSAFHLEVSSQPDGVHVVDLGSRNGTWFGGARIERALLPSGALVQLGNAWVQLDLVDEPAATASRERGPMRFGDLLGAAAVMRQTMAYIARLAPTELSVLIVGATGTGKELAARAIHAHSPRSQGPFLALDCTSIPGGIAESTLFGHEKGAFSGANESRAGIFESAHGGTIFLDEIGELPTDLQPKLLRVLERREVMRVGSHRTRPIDVRVLSATWRNLHAMTNEGRFREDLLYRVAQAHVTLPSLRERRDDIPMLVQHFLSQSDARASFARHVGPEALAELCQREYPGNVRELRNVVIRAAALAEGSVITPKDLMFEQLVGGRGAESLAAAVGQRLLPPGDDIPPWKRIRDQLIDGLWREYLPRLMSRTGWNLSEAARLAGVDRNHLREMCQRYGVSSSE